MVRCIWYVILILAAAVGYKFLINWNYCRRCQKLKAEYLEWLKGNTEYNIHEKRNEILGLFKQAGVEDRIIPVTMSPAPDYIQQASASAFENLTAGCKKINIECLQIFDNAIGVFKTRKKEAFNPLYWLDLLLFAPRNFLNYIGAGESTSAKICNIILQILWWIVEVLLVFFHDKALQIVEVVKNIF